MTTRAIAYLCSEYPAISHTFIHREIESLRKAGMIVHTASIHRPTNLSVMTSAEQLEAEQTMMVLSQSISSIIGAHLHCMYKNPTGYLRMATGALKLFTKGPKSPVKALAYFAERISIESDLFEIAPLQTQTQLAFLVDENAPKLNLKDKFIFTCAPIGWEKQRERDYFLSCLDCVTNNQLKGLPSDVTWLNSTSPKNLEDAEDLSKDISLYAWLAHKFPKHFYQLDELPALRNKVNRYIEAALLIQAGYRDTSKELMYQIGRG